MYRLTNTSAVFRLEDKVHIPAADGNADYVEYQRWLADGGTPEPAEIVDPRIEITSKITAMELQNILPRVVREYVLGAFKAEAQKAGLDPMLLPAYVKLKALDDQIAALRAQL